MDQDEILNQMQQQVRFLNDALEKYKYQFDQDTLARLSEELSSLTQNIMEIDKELRLLQQLQPLTDNAQIKKDQS
ncbi:MAG: hypothetical protein AMK74_04705 [Nitrospira bacterium SM23_35]|jgi:hypothetical protein|nr:MAG: hypothetical protein AMK74_04705 [Nitrospira bacterium SM23_35]